MTPSNPPFHPRAHHSGVTLVSRPGWHLGDPVKHGPGAAVARSPGAAEDDNEKDPSGPGSCCSLANRAL